MAAKVLEVPEAAARSLLKQVKYKGADKANAKKLGEMLGKLPEKLEKDEDEDPDLDKKAGALLDKVSDAVAKERNIKVIASESSDDDDEDEAPAKGKGKKGAKAKKAKDDDDEDEDEDEDKPKKKKKGANSAASYARMKEQGAKVDKALAKAKNGSATVASLAEKTDLTESRVQRHIDWLEKKGKVKVNKKGRISTIEEDEDDEE